jgi:hypothetical protein
MGTARGMTGIAGIMTATMITTTMITTTIMITTITMTMIMTITTPIPVRPVTVVGR